MHPVRAPRKRFFPDSIFPSMLLLLALGAGCSSTPPCEDEIVWVPGSEEVDIPKNDRLLICGDPSHRSWKRIPPNQASKFLRGFLESKGYLQPKIDVDYEKDRLLVNAGPLSKITSLVVAAPRPPFWSTSPLETHIGEPLTKSTLDVIQADATALLMENGFPCAKVELRATPEGEVEIRLYPGPPHPFTESFDLSPFPLKAGLLTRYEPFVPGESFDIRKLTLASRRIESDAVASSAAYLARCQNPLGSKAGADAHVTTTDTGGLPMRVERSLSLGARRLWEFGAGASTEEYPILFARWKNSRLWSSASRFETYAYGSNRRQRLSFDLRWYYDEGDPRNYLRPNFTVEHQNERTYETIETTAFLHRGRIIDVGSWSLYPEGGLALRRIRILQSPGTRTDTLVSPELSMEARSNQFELYQGNPRSGLNTKLDYAFVGQGLGSAMSAHRVTLSGTALYNWKAYRDPTWILGVRYTIGSILVAGGRTPTQFELPPDWFFLLGGDQNLRGFARNAIPRDNEGAGTIAYAGAESRWPSAFSFPLEPLVFFDVAKFGEGNATLSPILYLSPGIGGRYGTPIGTVRATLARGIALAEPIERRWQLFVSLGTEF
jgi:translocation and assembly module TamA